MATVAQISPLIDLLVEAVLREMKEEKFSEVATAPVGTETAVSGATGSRQRISHEHHAQKRQQG